MYYDMEIVFAIMEILNLTEHEAKIYFDITIVVPEDKTIRVLCEDPSSNYRQHVLGYRDELRKANVKSR